MTFSEAITAAKAGTKVKRTGWQENISVVKPTDVNHIVKTTTTTIAAPYLPTQLDMMSDDWVTT